MRTVKFFFFVKIFATALRRRPEIFLSLNPRLDAVISKMGTSWRIKWELPEKQKGKTGKFPNKI